MVKQYKKYLDVPLKYRWNLEFILDGKKPEWFITEIEKIGKKMILNKDSKYESKSKFLNSLKLDSKKEQLLFKIYNYISNSINQNIVHTKYNALMEKFQFIEFNISSQMGSELNRIFKHASNVQKWIQDPDFKQWRKNIQSMLDQKKHKLSNQVEDFITKTSRAKISASSTFDILSDVETIRKDVILPSGKKVGLSYANKLKLLKHKSRDVRKQVYTNWRDGILAHKESMSNLLFQHFKEIGIIAAARKYDGAVQSMISKDKADIKLLETLYSEVQNNKIIFKKYRKAKAHFFKAKYKENYIKKYDSQMPLVNIKNEYTVEQAQAIIKKAMKPFGKEYNEVINKAFKERWIDYMPVKNKSSGAYSIGASYGLDKKYILMNFDGTINSVSTLAHELGHSLHSYFSDTRQTLDESQYPIFLAEIASIFNELMLNDYLINNSDDEKFKLTILEEDIKHFIGSVMVQTEWSNFEFDMYKGIEAGKPFSTYETIAKVYYDNFKKYSNKNIKFNANDYYMSIAVPHFYMNFYVYKYAIGYIVANVFFQRYKKHGKKALQDYIDKFLSAGSKDWPIQILKNAGIDLYDKLIYKEAFEIINQKIENFIKIGNKIFKVRNEK